MGALRPQNIPKTSALYENCHVQNFGGLSQKLFERTAPSAVKNSSGFSESLTSRTIAKVGGGTKNNYNFNVTQGSGWNRHMCV